MSRDAISSSVIHAHDGFVVAYRHVDGNQGLIESVGLVAVLVRLLESVAAEVEEDLVVRPRPVDDPLLELPQDIGPGRLGIQQEAHVARSNPRSLVTNSRIAMASLTGPTSPETWR